MITMLDYHVHHVDCTNKKIYTYQALLFGKMLTASFYTMRCMKQLGSTACFSSDICVKQTLTEDTQHTVCAVQINQPRSPHQSRVLSVTKVVSDWSSSLTVSPATHTHTHSVNNIFLVEFDILI